MNGSATLANARKVGEVGMKEYIMRYENEYLQLLPDKMQGLVRCKDCKHRGDAEKCVLAAISEEKDCPLFMLDNRGEWFCADGRRRDE